MNGRILLKVCNILYQDSVLLFYQYSLLIEKIQNQYIYLVRLQGNCTQ